MTGQALVRWGGRPPWKYHGASGSGTVAVDHSDYTVEADLDTVVDAEIAERTDNETTVSLAMAVEPRNDDDTPYTDFGLGDAIEVPDIDGTPQKWRTVTIKVRETATGNVEYGLEANSRIEDDVARVKKFLNMATPGTLSGRGDSVASSDLGAGVDWGRLQLGEMGTYHYTDYLVAEVDPDDPDDPGHSAWWPLDENLLIYRHPWSLLVEGDTDTIVLVRYREPDQVTVHSYPFTIPAGVFQPDDDTGGSSFYTNLSAMKGGAIQVAIYQAGDSAKEIVWRTKYTSQT